MRLLGNLLWCILGGLLSALSWAAAGLLWCITIVGIPIGLQCFKFASLSLFPFGKEVVYGGGAPSLLLNILWRFFPACRWPSVTPPGDACSASPLWEFPSGCSSLSWRAWH